VLDVAGPVVVVSSTVVDDETVVVDTEAGLEQAARSKIRRVRRFVIKRR
jgi:CO dehydrogenase nickel-insertion accessory protein CooC1